jgi:hypothetical protein
MTLRESVFGLAKSKLVEVTSITTRYIGSVKVYIPAENND